jgi:hypothetical protein
MIEEGYEQQRTNGKIYLYNILALNTPGILGYAREYGSLQEQLENAKENPVAPQETVDMMKAGVDEHFENYHAPTDQRLMAGMYRMYDENIPAEQHPEYFKELKEEYKGDFDAMAEEIFEKSIFSSKEKVLAFLDNPKAKTLAKDPALALGTKSMEGMMGAMSASRGAQVSISKGNRLFVAGLREMHPEKEFYPDANSTMRLTYGSVRDYYPADAIHYNYVTYLSGVMEKEDPTNDEFIVPERLKELYEEKDFGRYGTKDGRLVVGFLTTNDITGGNSGSPVINGNGELIGLAFDGNWEAMSGDIAFEPMLQRTICVDARYVLFVIEKYAGATNLIDELTIVE